MATTKTTVAQDLAQLVVANAQIAYYKTAPVVIAHKREIAVAAVTATVVAVLSEVL